MNHPALPAPRSEAGLDAGGVSASTPGYHGQPWLKAPVWTWEIPLYLFVGGLSGMAAAMVPIARATAQPAELTLAALALAFAGALIAPLLLILDLGRPRRFLNMLRVFKLRSPMSVGAWILAAFGVTVGPAFLMALWTWFAARPPGGRLELSGSGIAVVDSTWIVPPPSWLPWLSWPTEIAAALLGLGLATYTGVLLGATVVPAWRLHHRLLPLHFGLASMGSAAAALELLGFRVPPLAALGWVAAAAETAVMAWLEVRRRPADEALRQGRGGLLMRVGGALAGPVSLLLRGAVGPAPAAASFLAGSLIVRQGWMEAGRQSARDARAAADIEEGG